MQLISKIDESGTHGQSPYMTMAGYTARLNQWSRFDLQWMKALRKAGLDHFHATEMYSHPFAPKAVKIADRNLLFGFVVKLYEADYRKFYRDGDGWGGKAQPDSMYGLCFRYCLSFILNQAALERPKKDFTLNFVVEDGHKNAGAPASIIADFKRKKISDVSEHLGTVVLEKKKAVPGLQAADALAFGAWAKASDSVPRITVSPHATVKSLKATSFMKAPLFLCDINERELKIFKQDYFAHIDLRRQFWEKNRHGQRA